MLFEQLVVLFAMLSFFAEGTTVSYRAGVMILFCEEDSDSNHFRWWNLLFLPIDGGDHCLYEESAPTSSMVRWAIDQADHSDSDAVDFGEQNPTGPSATAVIKWSSGC